jgi:hypothetical protein
MLHNARNATGLFDRDDMPCKQAYSPTYSANFTMQERGCQFSPAAAQNLALPQKKAGETALPRL